MTPESSELQIISDKLPCSSCFFSIFFLLHCTFTWTVQVFTLNSDDINVFSEQGCRPRNCTRDSLNEKVWDYVYWTVLQVQEERGGGGEIWFDLLINMVSRRSISRGCDTQLMEANKILYNLWCLIATTSVKMLHLLSHYSVKSENADTIHIMSEVIFFYGMSVCTQVIRVTLFTPIPTTYNYGSYCVLWLANTRHVDMSRFEGLR